MFKSFTFFFDNFNWSFNDCLFGFISYGCCEVCHSFTHIWFENESIYWICSIWSNILHAQLALMQDHVCISFIFYTNVRDGKRSSGNFLIFQSKWNNSMQMFMKLYSWGMFSFLVVHIQHWNNEINRILYIH